MIENRSGVLINSMGYFFVYKHPFVFRTRIGMKHLKRYENDYFEEEEMDDVPMDMSVEDKFADEASELFGLGVVC